MSLIRDGLLMTTHKFTILMICFFDYPLICKQKKKKKKKNISVILWWSVLLGIHMLCFCYNEVNI